MQVLPAIVASLLLHAVLVGALVAGAHRAQEARPIPVSLSVSLVKPTLPIAAAAPSPAAPLPLAPAVETVKPQPTRVEPLRPKPQRKPEAKSEAAPKPVDEASAPAPTDALPREEPAASTSSSMAAQNSASGAETGPATAPPQRTSASAASYAATNRKPTYPRLARSSGEQGTVVLRVLVQTDGAVGALDVARSSGYPLLDESARTAVRNWRFHPATVDGKPVAEWHDVPILFTLHEP